MWDSDDQSLRKISDCQLEAVETELILKCHPAKDIIDGRCTPDTPAKLKLMSIEKKLAQRLTREETRRKLMEANRTNCNDWDTMLCHLQEHIRKMVYIRFDNHGFMTTQVDNKNVQYFAGFFYPVEQAASLADPYTVYERAGVPEFCGLNSDPAMWFGDRLREFQEGVCFTSAFPSGNLFAALRRSFCSYDLIMQNDMNSKGNTQWFNFAVRFSIVRQHRFRIINFTKSHSLYNEGMRVVAFSYREGEYGKSVWLRCGNNIRYGPTGINREDSHLAYYSLQFDYTPMHEDDIVVFSSCYPYNHHDLECLVSKMPLKRGLSRLVKIDICKSIAGVKIYALKFGVQSDADHRGIGKKKSLVFMARQHPGETPGSYVIEGVIEALINFKNIEQLKRQFIIYVIPMVNPDGVIYGNYRTNLAGSDLNRRWRTPSPNNQPEVYYLRKFLVEVNRLNPIGLIIDFHGHSRKNNCFFYGNPSNDTVFAECSRVFPYMCSRRNARISFEECTFNITEDKRNTARVVLQELFPSALIYTFESSFNGSTRNRNGVEVYEEFTIDGYKRIGRDVLLSYVDYQNLLARGSHEHKEKMLKDILALARWSTEDDEGSDEETEKQFKQEPVTKQEEIARMSPKELRPSRTMVSSIYESSKLRLSKPRTSIKKLQTSVSKSEYINRYVKQEGDIPILRILPLKTSNSLLVPRRSLKIVRSRNKENKAPPRKEGPEQPRVDVIQQGMIARMTVGSSFLYINNMTMEPIECLKGHSIAKPFQKYAGFPLRNK